MMNVLPHLLLLLLPRVDLCTLADEWKDLHTLDDALDDGGLGGDELDGELGGGLGGGELRSGRIHWKGGERLLLVVGIILRE